MITEKSCKWQEFLLKELGKTSCYTLLKIENINAMVLMNITFIFNALKRRR